MLQREPEVPARLEFVRTIDVEGTVERIESHGRGAQIFRLRTRYLDPDVNAFVGLQTGVSHFNQFLRLGNPDDPDMGGILWNWGANVGVIRGKHLWEVDLMGAVFGNRLGPALAVVGEHALSKHWTFFHRSEGNFFTVDAVADLDQGIWYQWGPVGISVGYRVFIASHTNRDGPRVGLILRFENPKIPFFFPSIG